MRVYDSPRNGKITAPSAQRLGADVPLPVAIRDAESPGECHVDRFSDSIKGQIMEVSTAISLPRNPFGLAG